LAEERTHFWARERPPTHVPVHNIDEDLEEEEWHLDVEDDDIQDVIYTNINEIEDEIYVKEIVKERQMSVHFINQEIKHSCT
jgi:hypothetical protein